MKRAHRFTMMRCDCPLDDENFSRLRHGRAAFSQDCQSPIVIPIVNYLSQNVDVPARRKHFEKSFRR